ncbi:uncharacterized protein G2W53_012362 [Senna tora]|uniref:Uncharacterized protein n=1 Tax=Senna tora TaxID=362788 RepID=A0A834WSJ7_9FABA|nr:uncharacterized protein G2W53_012362 [Senna tora]
MASVKQFRGLREREENPENQTPDPNLISRLPWV